MVYENLLWEIKEGIGYLTLNRPQSLNALNNAVLQELSGLLDEIAENNEVEVVVVTGAGKAFIAGADIKEMAEKTALEAREFSALGHEVMLKLENLPQPTIAAVNGYALGGGLELAMACDMRVASKKAKFGQPEVGLGVIPGFGGTQRLPRLIGKAFASEMLYTGGMYDAEQAYQMGLVNRVVEPEELMDSVEELARQIMSKGKIAVQLAKSAVVNGLDMDLDSALAYEKEIFALCFATEDQKEGMRAFINKEKPQFKGK
ncbi:MAG: enoyl-CoA hydratase/isomerase family protein [Thermoanaerobacteraceae bacterium]|nr:enoyl-CoA hydratase/isomerase family protein [Thermoanaerobacteraceae bacterium]